jgi:hypothetical protein
MIHWAKVLKGILLLEVSEADPGLFQEVPLISGCCIPAHFIAILEK